MRPSTLLELAGFGLVTYAAYSWSHIVGLLVGGLLLLLIGYAVDDASIVRTPGRVYQALQRKRTKRRHKKAG